MQGIPTRSGFRHESIAATAAGADGPDIATFDVQALEQLYFVIAVSGAALTGFNVLANAVPGGTFVSVASAGADYTTPVAPVINASGDLTAAAVGNHNLLLDVHGMNAVKINATSGGGAFVALQAGGN